MARAQGAEPCHVDRPGAVPQHSRSTIADSPRPRPHWGLTRRDAIAHDSGIDTIVQCHTM
eukprot:4143760-Prymnesium_polylepis.2